MFKSAIKPATRGSGQVRYDCRDIEEDVMVFKVRDSMPLHRRGAALKVLLTCLPVHNPADTFADKLERLL